MWDVDYSNNVADSCGIADPTINDHWSTHGIADPLHVGSCGLGFLQTCQTCRGLNWI